MSSPVVVTLGFGKATPPIHMASLSCFRVRPPFARDSGATSGRTVAGPNGMYLYGAVEQFGAFYTKTVEHRAGEILLLQGSWKRKSLPVRDGAVFIRLRQSGAHWSIAFKVPMEQQNRIGATALAFEGTGDIMSADELQALGLTVPGSYVNKFMQDEEVDECFELRKLREETSPRPSLIAVVDNGVTKVVEAPSAPKRRMMFLRK